MRRTVLVVLVLTFLLVTCRPAAKPAPTSAQRDTATTVVRPGDVCPPAETAQAATPTAAKPQTEPPGKTASPDSTRRSAPPVKRETTASKSEVAEVPARAAALPRLWDFGSEKCIPCKFMTEIMTPMMKEFAGKVDIRIINIYQEPALSNQHRIQIIPTQIFMDASGKELYRHIGAFPRDSILLKFRECGFISTE